MLYKFRVWSFLVLAAASATLYVGCNRSQPEAPRVDNAAPPQPVQNPGAKQDGEHGHKPGSHGGIIVEIGRDNYHAEAVFEKGGTLRFYTLGKDEAKVQEVESQTLTAYVKPEGGTESSSFLLQPEPQPGDAEGKTSQFVGRLPQELWSRKVEVTIPSLRIEAERFRVGFTNASVAHAEEGMPAKVSDEEERKLYLTPGGKYTAADIRANGNQTASKKFQGLKSSHNVKTGPGDKICPISETKANPQFIWIVGGKAYEFCCPPCVDEFVKMAKEKPGEIKEPEEYRKK